MTMGRLIPVALALGALAFGALAVLTARTNVAAVPPPPNDNFADAQAIASLPFADLNVSTSAATTQLGEPSPSMGDCESITNTVWYTFTPAADAVLQGDTFGSDFDTVLAVYTGATLPALTNVACNDDAGSELLQSKVVFSAMAGVTYRFQVGGFPGTDESGRLDFHLAVASAPLNDDFANAEAIPSIPFTAGPFSTDGATVQGGEPSPCGGIGKTVWYDFTPSVNMNLQADTFGSDYDTVLAVYTGATLNTLTSIACNDDAPDAFQSQLEFSATGGVTYHFQAGGFLGGSGNLVLHLAQGAADADGDGVPDSSDNCPNWPNPTQNLPPWPVPEDDPDCDGFASPHEVFVGTEPLLACGPGAWPPDIDSNGHVQIDDVAFVAGKFGLVSGETGYTPRAELGSANGVIQIDDVAAAAGWFGKAC
jgi:hypothetical protein